MPIPFLLIGIGAGAAALGIGKSVKAAVDLSDAKTTNKSAQEIVDMKTQLMNTVREHTGDSLTTLGQTKLDILNDSVRPFILSFEQLHNVDFEGSPYIDELKKLDWNDSLVETKELCSAVSSMLGGTVSGAALGAVTAFGAYGAAITFGAASTGTAIASLSGVAATNATMAFLGGGSLAAGGLGIAGGTAVLGGLVAGPALAVMGFVVGAKASANKDAAYANLAKAQEYAAEIDAGCVACNGIRMRANMFSRLLMKLDALFDPLRIAMDETIRSAGNDFSTYTQEQKNVVGAALAVEQAIKAVINTPLLTEEGALTEESEKVLDQSAIQAALEKHAQC